VDEFLVAGNSGINAKTRSPGGLESVITVGSVAFNGKMASDSNYGSLVNMFAPGVKIFSTWYAACSCCE